MLDQGREIAGHGNRVVAVAHVDHVGFPGRADVERRRATG